MKKFALIADNEVKEIRSMEDGVEFDTVEAKLWQAIIEVTEVVPEPEVGWDLVGTELVDHTPPTNPDELDAYQQTSQRKMGEILCKKATDLVGARNLKLARELVPIDVATLAGQMLSLKTLMEGGALKTVRGLCAVMKAAHPNHADILQGVMDDITAFLIKNNWN